MDMLNIYEDQDQDLWRSCEDDRLAVFIDGCCLNNGYQNAQAGYGVWFNHNHPLNLSERVKGYQTSNNAEIQAAIAAIYQCISINEREILLFSDSEYIINCSEKWIYNWNKYGWKTIHGHPVKNKYRLIKLHKLLTSTDVKFEHVLAHSGIEGNEEADELAKRGAEEDLDY